ncbi:putative reverse transcriptase domain-containing protein [Tanacetum coccineum]|uniref:Reverse transcriptase domain-containing protein n=1 Tax=Tanacetum coccineum TaxID=301880 RepID=A0ABQ4XME8_9ASTR
MPIFDCLASWMRRMYSAGYAVLGLEYTRFLVKSKRWSWPFPSSLFHRTHQRRAWGHLLLELSCSARSLLPFHPLGTNDEDTHEHVQRVLEIADLFHFPDITHDIVMLRVFPITLKGPALRWINRLSAGLVTTWDLLEKAFIRQYCPPFKTTKKLEIIRNFKQEMDETLYSAWERYNDLLPNNVDTMKPKEDIHVIQASFKKYEGEHLTMEYPLEKEDKAVKNVKERTTMGKEYVKEPVPSNLPAQFLGNPYKTRKTIYEIGIPKEIKEDEGDINDSYDITVKDVERLRKILTPPIHALPNLKPIVQPYMPLELVYNKAKVVKEEEHDYDIPLREHHLNEFGEEFADNTRVFEKIDSNPVNDLKELLKTYDFENFIRKLKHQLSQSSHETGSLYKEMELEVSLTRVRVVERFCIGLTTKGNVGSQTNDLPVSRDDTPLIPTDTPTTSPIVPTILPIAPTIQYTSLFVCTDSSDSNTPERPPSQDPYEVPVARWRSRVVGRSSPQSPLIRQILPAPPSLPRRPAMLTVRKRVGPLATHRLALRYSAGYSSSDHFTSDDSSRDSPSDSSSETSLDYHSDTSSDSSLRHSSSGYAISDSPCDSLTATSARPSRERHRSPTTLVLVASPVREALSPVRVDLLPPRKRIRDFDSVTDFEVSSEEGFASYVPREIDLEVDVDDTRGTDVRVKMETAAEEEADSSARGTIEIGVDRVTHVVVSDDIGEPVREDFPEWVSADGSLEVMQRGLDVVMQELYDRMMEIPVHRVGVIESVQRDQRLRGMLGVKRQRVDRLRRSMSYVQRDLRQIRRFRFYDHVRIEGLETYARRHLGYRPSICSIIVRVAISSIWSSSSRLNEQDDGDEWLTPIQCLPTILEGPGSVVCDVDVDEFSYFGAPELASKEQLYTEIMDDLRGSGSCIGSGSQVASQETYGSLGAIDD